MQFRNKLFNPWWSLPLLFLLDFALILLITPLQPDPEQRCSWEADSSASSGRTSAAPIRKDGDTLSTVCSHCTGLVLSCFFFPPLGAVRLAAPVSNLLTPAEGGLSPTHSLSGWWVNSRAGLALRRCSTLEMRKKEKLIAYTFIFFSPPTRTQRVRQTLAGIHKYAARLGAFQHGF